ncbi:MAG: hypothetical protein FWD82_08950 [Defluviitaleaceae bacterium]|nr:hypothetical protein [Defluviitaleaceae bacterium]
MNLNQEFIENLKSEGCDIVGFADLSVLPEELRAKLGKGLSVGIIMATTYAPEAVWDKLSNTQKQTIRDDWKESNPLERYNKAAKAFLKEKGYKRNTTYSTMEITYKMLATIAGLGWIGKCALLVSKKQGPAVRFTAVLTDAPFECGEAIEASNCPPNCSFCADICPASAISGRLWQRGVHRDEFFNVESCKKLRSKCDTVCIANCPYTKEGLEYS